MTEQELSQQYSQEQGTDLNAVRAELTRREFAIAEQKSSLYREWRDEAGKASEIMDKLKITHGTSEEKLSQVFKKHPKEAKGLAHLNESMGAKSREMAECDAKIKEINGQIIEISNAISGVAQPGAEQEKNAVFEKKKFSFGDMLERLIVGKPKKAGEAPVAEEQAQAPAKKQEDLIRVSNELAGLVEQRDSAAAKRDAKQKEVSELEAKLKDAVDRKKRLFAEEGSLLMEIERKQGLVPNGRPKKTVRDLELAALMDYDEFEARVAQTRKQARQQIKEMNAKIEGIKEERAAASKEIASLRGKIKRRSMKLDGMESELSASQSEVERKKAEFFELSNLLEAQKEKAKGPADIADRVANSLGRAKAAIAEFFRKSWKKIVIGTAIVAIALTSIFGIKSCQKTAEGEVAKKAIAVQVAPDKEEEKKADKDVFAVPDVGGYWHISDSILSAKMPGFGDMSPIEKRAMTSTLSRYLQENHGKFGITPEMEHPHKGDGAPWLNHGASLRFTDADLYNFVKQALPKQNSMPYKPAPTSNTQAGSQLQLVK